MACKYFIEDYFGFCGITAYSHIPHISELEQLCFKDFQACWIYNEYESSHVPVGAKEPSNSTKRMQTCFEHRHWEDLEDELVRRRQGTGFDGVRITWR